jgi:hypothetical protein
VVSGTSSRSRELGRFVDHLCVLFSSGAGGVHDLELGSMKVLVEALDADQVLRLEREPRAEQRGFYLLPLTRPLPMVKRSDDRERVVHAGRDVDVVDRAGTAGCSLRVRVVGHDSGGGVRDDVEPLALPVRPYFAERRAGKEDQARVLQGQRGVVDAEFLRDARRVVLDDDVDLRDQPVEDSAARFTAQIDGQALFAVVERERHARVATVAFAISEPALLGAVRRLDLDHARAQVGEQRSAVRPRDVLGDVEHGDAVEHGSHVLTRSVSASIAARAA